MEDIIRRHPEILDIKIDRPIIVAGLPRSGTTHLIGLLSADKRLRSLPWWEAIAPVPAPGDEPTTDDPNPRWTRAEEGWKGQEAVLPYMKIMHEFSADHISEEDRKSVEEGKSVSVRVDLGGRGNIKKKNKE